MTERELAACLPPPPRRHNRRRLSRPRRACRGESRPRIFWSTSSAITSSARSSGRAATRKRRRRCVGLSRRALYRRLERLDLSGTISAAGIRRSSRPEVAPVRVPSGGAGIVAAQTPVDEARRSVLVVDDEASVRHLMRRWLESRGYGVVVAASADQALELLAETPAAVALCDLRMPGRDGLWLTDQLRREHPDTAVIIATGMNDVSTVEGLRRGRLRLPDQAVRTRPALRAAVSRGVDWHRTALDARRWREQLEFEMRTRRTHLQQVIASQFPDSSEDLDLLLGHADGVHTGGLPSTPIASRPCPRHHSPPSRPRRGGSGDRGEGGTSARCGQADHPRRGAKNSPLTLREQRLVRLYPQIG